MSRWCLWGDVDHETQARPATTGGIVGHTGVGGLSPGGGIGWPCASRLTVDTWWRPRWSPLGRHRPSFAHDHPDLFWALRGGGGNWRRQLVPVRLAPCRTTVIAGPVFWAAEDTTDVLRFYREFVADAPDELGTTPAWHDPAAAGHQPRVALPTGDRGGSLAPAPWER